MEWCKLFASLEDDERVLELADEDLGAAWLLVQSFMYCTRAKNGGHIPRAQVQRFGGPDLERRAKLCVKHDVWVPSGTGYDLEPTIWSEARNLSIQVSDDQDKLDRKRRRDRERMAAKRAAAREPDAEVADVAAASRDMSRDGRATSRATVAATPCDTLATGRATPGDTERHVAAPESLSTGPTGQTTSLIPLSTALNGLMSRDSRQSDVARQSPPREEERRQEKNSSSLPSAPTATLIRAEAEEEGEGEISGDLDLGALVDEIRAAHPGWTRDDIMAELIFAEESGRARPVVVAAARACYALDRATSPGLLRTRGPWWNVRPARPTSARPDWCERCYADNCRFVPSETEPGKDAPCPRCNPKGIAIAKEAAS